MSTFKLACPHCAGHVEAQDDWVGQEAECPHCGKSMLVRKAPEDTVLPAVAEATPAEPAEPAPPGDTKECPFCAETIEAQTERCRFCDRDLGPTASAPAGVLSPTQQTRPSPAAVPKSRRRTSVVAIAGAACVLVLAVMVGAVMFVRGSWERYSIRKSLREKVMRELRVLFDPPLNLRGSATLALLPEDNETTTLIASFKTQLEDTAKLKILSDRSLAASERRSDAMRRNEPGIDAASAMRAGFEGIEISSKKMAAMVDLLNDWDALQERSRHAFAVDRVTGQFVAGDIVPGVYYLAVVVIVRGDESKFLVWLIKIEKGGEPELVTLAADDAVRL